MSSTDQNRSIGSGISIPQWMKSKTDNYGFDPSALSPPTHEDDFFHIKFPKAAPQPVETTSAAYTNLNELIEVKEQAFSNHTTSCKQFLPKIKDTVQTAKTKVIKPMGVDDGFKGEGAACGASVVAVAQQMLAGTNKSPVRGFTTDDAAEKPPPSYMRQRRNSKSLPASPLATPDTSPRTRRKNNTSYALQNRFFTGAFLGADKTLNESEENLDKKSGSSWLLSGLFSNNRDEGKPQGNQSLVASDELSNKIIKPERNYSEPSVINTGMTEAVNVTVQMKTAAAATSTLERTLFRPKPSELREMNFWSPTSM